MGNQNRIRENFGQRAANYRLSSTHGNQVDLERMINLLQPHPGDIALDVATGGGHTAIALAKVAKQVVAIDLTPEMLVEAQAAAEQGGRHNIEFQLADVHNLKFKDGQFDLVASRFAPHHFSEIKQALREMCRVLKPGGKLYILDCSIVDGAEPEKEINRLEFLRDSSHHYSYSPRQWNELLRRLPLTIEHAALLQTQYELPQWFNRMSTPTSNQQEIFSILNNLSAEYKALYPFGDDYLTTYRYEILAIKS